jgi:hypothetical protein
MYFQTEPKAAVVEGQILYSRDEQPLSATCGLMQCNGDGAEAAAQR